MLYFDVYVNADEDMWQLGMSDLRQNYFGEETIDIQRLCVQYYKGLAERLQCTTYRLILMVKCDLL